MTAKDRAEARRQRRALRNLKNVIASETGKAYALADLESAERRRQRIEKALELYQQRLGQWLTFDRKHAEALLRERGLL
jgi:hypothetical protein